MAGLALESSGDLDKAGVAVANRFAALHEMLYMRGGIRPVNAAIDELCKLLFLELAARAAGDLQVVGFGTLADVLDPSRIRSAGEVSGLKAAFTAAIALEPLKARLPDGSAQTVWPVDEPFRLSTADVAAAGLEVISDALRESSVHGAQDTLGIAFDMFLRGKYEHAGGLGTYLTPHPVTSAMARIALELTDLLAAPIKGPVFGDPCCGTGRFLVSVYEELGMRISTPDLHGRLRTFARDGIFGADQSTSSVAMARLNLLAFGVQRPYVFAVQDSITDPTLDRLRGSLRLVLTNPPFGDRKYDSAEGIRRTTSILPGIRANGTIDPALAFVARCLDLLDDGGVCGIVLPDGIVDGPVLRRMLLAHPTLTPAEVSVEANVSLPTATFSLGGTTAKTSALFLRRGPSSRSHVFLARADHVGYVKQGGGVVHDPEGNDLPAIADLAEKHIPAPVTEATSVPSETPGRSGEAVGSGLARRSETRSHRGRRKGRTPRKWRCSSGNADSASGTKKACPQPRRAVRVGSSR